MKKKFLTGVIIGLVVFGIGFGFFVNEPGNRMESQTTEPQIYESVLMALGSMTMLVFLFAIASPDNKE